MKKVIILSSKKNPYGDEIIINGGFDTDTDWNKGTGWTISDGTANGGAGWLQPTPVLTIDIGKTYFVSVEVVSIVGGGVDVRIGGVQAFVTSGTGIFTGEVTATGTSNLQIRSSSFSGSIDNVSVKEVL